MYANQYGKHPYFQTHREEQAEAWREEIARLVEEGREYARKPGGRVLPISTISAEG